MHTLYDDNNTVDWYEFHKDRIILHPDTRNQVEALLYGN